MTVERFGSEGSLKPHISNRAPSGAIQLGPLVLGRPTFLLDPGGQDYVGNNSYDDTSRMDE